jgi:hypothetical protein
VFQIALKHLIIAGTQLTTRVSGVSTVSGVSAVSGVSLAG